MAAHSSDLEEAPTAPKHRTTRAPSRSISGPDPHRDGPVGGASWTWSHLPAPSLRPARSQRLGHQGLPSPSSRCPCPCHRGPQAQMGLGQLDSLHDPHLPKRSEPPAAQTSLEHSNLEPPRTAMPAMLYSLSTPSPQEADFKGFQRPRDAPAAATATVLPAKLEQASSSHFRP